MAFALNVVDLHYQPPINILKVTEQETRFFLNQHIPRKYTDALPHIVSESSQHAPLHSISFRATSGHITAILSNDLTERQSIIDLLISRRFTGKFDGQLVMEGMDSNSTYEDNMAFVHRKTVFVPGLTYTEMLHYAARLRMRWATYEAIRGRVDELLRIMDLVHCKDRKILEYPPLRGIQGGELRRLSIAVEIVNLPSLIVIEDPALRLEPAIAASIFACMRTLAQAGHAVVCAMEKPTAQIFSFIDNVVLISDGYSIYAGSIARAEGYFCSIEMGYVKKPENHLVNFLLDIAKGTERPITQRSVESPVLLQEKFESSDLHVGYVPSEVPVVFGLPAKNYFYECLVLPNGRRQLHTLMQTFIIIERALFVKLMDFETIKRSVVASAFVGTVIGYLQYQCGNYGYYATTMLSFPYYGTANSTAVLFFCSAFSFGINVLTVQIVCQKLQMFRYEQFTGVCTIGAFLLATAISDVPFAIMNVVIFSSVVYFMTEMNFGVDNYLYFSYVIVLNSLVGLCSIYLFAAIFKKEIPVRDVFLFNTFLMVLLSGFAFQLPFIRPYFSDISQINPIRWTFEALLHWKFSTYEDGLAYLIPFSFATFDSGAIYAILFHFIIFSAVGLFLLLLPTPHMLYRSIRMPKDMGRSMSKDSVTSGEEQDVVRPPAPRTKELERPLLFTRETSITQKSQLSVNVSQSSVGPGAEAATVHGPTVSFRNLTYRVRDRFSPVGVKNILLNVSGQFDWGKLSMILGASMSGRSSLLHILAGDVGFQSEVSGDVLFNGQPADESLKLWQRCALVEAQDEQHRDITVRDVVTYAMKLRCPNKSFFGVVESNVQKTLDILRLNDVSNLKAKNLSKGERRRLSIAEEIVHGPSLLLIDEPTTDLTLHDESIMMATFREMVNQDLTVVAAMQNPSAAVYHLFDTVLLLSKGRVVFFGPTNEAASYFLSIPYGYSMEANRNPAEFIVDIAGGTIPCKKGDILAPAVLEQCFKLDSSKQRGKPAIGGIGHNHMTFTPLVQPTPADFADEEGNPRSPSSSMDLESAENKLVNKRSIFHAIVCPSIVTALVKGVADFFQSLGHTDWGLVWMQAEVLFLRAFFSLYGRKKLVFATLIMHVLIAAFLGWILGPTYNLVYNLTSFFAVSTLLLFFANMQLVYFLFTNHQVFLKEHSRGLYSTFLYWMVTQWPMYVLRAINGMLFAVISYALLVLGLNVEIEGFFVLTSIIATLAGHMVCEFVVFSIKDIRSAYMVLPALYFVFFAFSGLFIKPATLPDWIGPWAPSFSIIRWTMQADFINYFDGNTALFPTLPIASPYNVFLSLFGWGGKTKWFCLSRIVINIFVYKFLSLLAAGFTSISQKGGRMFKKVEVVEY